MAEEELDGFDNLDNLFGEEGGGEEGAAAAGGDLDDLLGDEGGGEAGGGGGEASDSELDSFFEDLSTIDDLEVAQEESPPEAAPEPEPEAAPAAAAAAAPAAAEAARSRRERKPKPERQKMGFFKRMVFVLIPILVIAGVTYWLFFTPSEEVPWEVAEQEEPFIEEPVREERTAAPPEEPPPPEPEPEPVAARQPPPEPEPTPPPQPAQPSVTYGIQVATCFFDSCVEAFRDRLDDRGIPPRVSTRNMSREALEIYSETQFASRDTAEQLAERINREHKLEGQAYARGQNGAYVVSMGTFTDLSRANIVKNALNQRMMGEVNFTTRIRNIPYTLKNVVGGRYASREAAEAARRNLASTDPRFSDAFVVRN